MNHMLTVLRQALYDPPGVTPNWRHSALCAQADPEAWTSQSAARSHYRQAKQICAVCPVRADCLEAALAFEQNMPAAQRVGMWGGQTPVQRKQTWNLRQRLERKPA